MSTYINYSDGDTTENIINCPNSPIAIAIDAIEEDAIEEDAIEEGGKRRPLLPADSNDSRIVVRAS